MNKLVIGDSMQNDMKKPNQPIPFLKNRIVCIDINVLHAECWQNRVAIESMSKGTLSKVVNQPGGKTLKISMAKHIVDSNCCNNKADFIIMYQQQRNCLPRIAEAVAIRTGLCVQKDMVVS